MDAIRFEQVTKRYGPEDIITNLNLVIPAGKFFALLGPSGCGKTTLLRLIGGFEQANSGKIFLDDIDVTYVPINKRRVNTVFQNYALFPHLNVFDNVAYGLRIKAVPAEDIKQRVLNVLAKVHLEKQAFKAIDQLSGGQQQRVALARAIINEPKVLLLDEPLAALDRSLKEQMLVELIELQYELKTTFVYVTHDQTEALAVADQMAIMNSDGEIEQVGTPKEVYEFPATSFVAKFVGKTNLFNGIFHEQAGGDFVVEVTGIGTFGVIVDSTKIAVANGRPVLLSIRPEKIEINKDEQVGFANHARGRVDGMIYHGRATEYLVDIDGRHINVFEQNEKHFARDTIVEGDFVHLYWQKENAVVLER
jgi:spermidine/putrescine transport system ATP-binding protein